MGVAGFTELPEQATVGRVNVRYLCGDEAVWTPAEHTDAVFRSLVDLHGRRHDTETGIDWSVDAQAVIDPIALAAFAQGVVDEWETVGSAAFHMLVDGFVSTLQVICERSGIELEGSDSADALAASMRRGM